MPLIPALRRQRQVGLCEFKIFFLKYLFIMYTIFCRPEEGTSLQMVVSHHVVARN